MTDRDRLIELLSATHTETDDYKEQARLHDEYIADHLLANGVIVPPCKVGDKLYIIATVSKDIVESVVIGLWIADEVFSILTIHGTIVGENLGKTIFLTKEEAEAKLKEMKGNE